MNNCMLRLTGVVCAVEPPKDWLRVDVDEAPVFTRDRTLHFFARDRGAFDERVGSFRVIF